MKNNLILLFKTLILVIVFNTSYSMTCLELSEHLNSLTKDYAQMFIMYYSSDETVVYAGKDKDFYVYFNEPAIIVKFKECREYKKSSLVILSNILKPSEKYGLQLNEKLIPNQEFKFEDVSNYNYRITELRFGTGIKDIYIEDRYKKSIETLDLELVKYMLSLQYRFGLNWLIIDPKSIITKENKLFSAYISDQSNDSELQYTIKIINKSFIKDDGKVKIVLFKDKPSDIVTISENIEDKQNKGGKRLSGWVESYETKSKRMKTIDTQPLAQETDQQRQTVGEDIQNEGSNNIDTSSENREDKGVKRSLGERESDKIKIKRMKTIDTQLLGQETDQQRQTVGEDIQNEGSNKLDQDIDTSSENGEEMVDEKKVEDLSPKLQSWIKTNVGFKEPYDILYTTRASYDNFSDESNDKVLYNGLLGKLKVGGKIVLLNKELADISDLLTSNIKSRFLFITITKRSDLTYTLYIYRNYGDGSIRFIDSSKGGLSFNIIQVRGVKRLQTVQGTLRHLVDNCYIIGELSNK